VEVEMVDGLATPAADVRDESIAVVGDSLAPCQLCGGCEQSPQERSLLLGQVGRRRDVAAGNDEDVGRGARRDVTEGDDEIVLV